MAVLPDGEGDERDGDADKIAHYSGHAMRCPYCARGPYRRYSNLAAHVAVHHPGQRPPRRLKYACVCHGRLFGHRWVRDQHERDAARTTCPHCGCEMARSNLRRHVNKCKYQPGGRPDPKHQCTECGLAFMTKRGAAATASAQQQPLTHPRTNPSRRHGPQGIDRHGRVELTTLRRFLRRNTEKNTNVVGSRLLDCHATKRFIFRTLNDTGTAKVSTGENRDRNGVCAVAVGKCLLVPPCWLSNRRSAGIDRVLDQRHQPASCD